MDDGERSVRLPAAIFVAPMFAALLCATALGVVTTCPGEYCQPGTIGFAAMIGTATGLGIGVPVMFVLGLPVHAVLRWARWNSVRAYALAGVLPGAVGAKALLLHLGPTQPEGVAALYLIGAVTGALSAALFWWIRRPDLDPPNPATQAQ